MLVPARSRRIAWFALSSAACMVITGCSDSSGTGAGGGGGGGGGVPVAGGGDTGGAASSGGSGGSGGSQPTCDGRCVDLPAGFDGVVHLGEGTDVGCNDPIFIGGDADQPYDAPEAECGCSCTVFDAICHAVATAYDAPGCSGSASEPFDAQQPNCENPPDTGAAWTSVTVEVTGAGECVSDRGAPILPPITFEAPLWGCPPSEGTCASGVCAPSNEKACFYSFDATECPAGLVLSRSVLRLDNIIDKRDCDCSCGPGTVECSTAVALYSDSSCNASLDPVESFGCTEDDTDEPFAAIALDDTFTSTCDDVTYTPVMDIEMAGGPILVCCEP